jgi:hypothetical protein
MLTVFLLQVTLLIKHTDRLSPPQALAAWLR